MRHIPHATRIFIGVLVITLLLTYLALTLSMRQAGMMTGTTETLPPAPTEQQAVQPKVDTTDWKTYQDKAYPIAFQYPKKWTVKGATNKMKFYDIVLNPGPKDPDMHILVSREGYYGLDGLKQTPYPVGNRTGFTVSDNLMGIKVGEYYYTFDGSLNNNQADEFSSLLTTVKFQ